MTLWVKAPTVGSIACVIACMHKLLRNPSNEQNEEVVMSRFLKRKKKEEKKEKKPEEKKPEEKK